MPLIFIYYVYVEDYAVYRVSSGSYVAKARFIQTYYLPTPPNSQQRKTNNNNK